MSRRTLLLSSTSATQSANKQLVACSSSSSSSFWLFFLMEVVVSSGVGVDTISANNDTIHSFATVLSQVHNASNGRTTSESVICTSGNSPSLYVRYTTTFLFF